MATPNLRRTLFPRLSPASSTFFSALGGLSPFHEGRSSPPPEALAFEEVRAPEGQDRPFSSTAIVLHGLLGSGRNWRSFARNLASQLQRSSPSDEWRMILVDLRNHGKSAGSKGLNPPHDLKNAARDLANLVESHKWTWPDVVIGHSMGGKVALQFAESCSSGDYGQKAILPKKNSYGFWIQFLEK